MAGDLLNLECGCCVPCSYACTTRQFTSIDLTFKDGGGSNLLDCNGAAYNRTLVPTPSPAYFDVPPMTNINFATCGKQICWNWGIACPYTTFNYSWYYYPSCGPFPNNCPSIKTKVEVALDVRLYGDCAFCLQLVGLPSSSYSLAWSFAVMWMYEFRVSATITPATQTFSGGVCRAATAAPYTCGPSAWTRPTSSIFYCYGRGQNTSRGSHFARGEFRSNNCDRLFDVYPAEPITKQEFFSGDQLELLMKDVEDLCTGAITPYAGSYVGLPGATFLCPNSQCSLFAQWRPASLPVMTPGTLAVKINP